MIKDFKNKKILILGLGLNEGGVGSAKFFAKKGADILVTDLKNADSLKPSLEKLKEFINVKYHLGGHKKEDIDWADLVIRNPALKPDNQFLKYAKEKGKKITTDLGIFLEFINRNQIIGVTGTKGKSTTASLIFEVIKKLHLGGLPAGRQGVTRKAILTGNIGKSVLDSIEDIGKDTLVILEISSFQLESFNDKKVSPKYAVITNIYQDHLNYYTSMEEYVASKKLIAINQDENDFLFVNKDDKQINNTEFLSGIKSQIVYFSSDDLPAGFKPLLPGKYNLSNFAAALAVTKKLGVGEDVTIKVFGKFKGVPFRMELVKEWNGVKIYNNTTATAPEPAIESLKTFPNSILICGGMNKGLDYGKFAQAIGKYAKEVYFLEGDATEALSNQLSAISQKKVRGNYNNLTALLEAVKKRVQSGDVILSPQVILFSPGATSFNLFQNEFDRGRKFNEAVERVFV
ncbi:UDP-N-acetylmuramoyl-L-alanine--D-glutamate ligase [Candidatus Daviesbacteria bacterium]|nr:UDP-N-acetylmuramoyl-L-alanine--D-glutamate ligase [Candidatus Daviesbacteria bacterium]